VDEGREEGLLDDVLGVFGLLDDAQRGGEDGRAVAADELVEGFGVARTGPGHQEIVRLVLREPVGVEWGRETKSRHTGVLLHESCQNGTAIVF